MGGRVGGWSGGAEGLEGVGLGAADLDSLQQHEGRSPGTGTQISLFRLHKNSIG